jgi:hypothetical protein
MPIDWGTVNWVNLGLLSVFAFVAALIGNGPVAGLVGIRGGVVSGVINLESSDVEASDSVGRSAKAIHRVPPPRRGGSRHLTFLSSRVTAS